MIEQVKLGLDVVCIQDITTSSFTKEALDFVDRIEGKRVVMFDGDRPAELMIEHGLGMTTAKTYELKEVSHGFFDESEG